MKIAILLENFVDEMEFIYPLFRFREEGFDVNVISPIVGEFKSKNGLFLKSNYSIDAVDSKDYDCVFVPGGYAPDRLRRNQKIINFIKFIELLYKKSNINNIH